MLTISNVQTLRIQTFSFPSTPSTSPRSTPSHQHLRAGFRQNRRSFCAIPTTLLPARSPLMSVRSLANAKLQMTALFGSPARWPHISSWSKPLYESVSPNQSVSCTYPAVNISIKCCSVVPVSSLLLKPEKMPSCLSSALPAARFTSIISTCSISCFGGMT